MHCTLSLLYPSIHLCLSQCVCACPFVFCWMYKFCRFGMQVTRGFKPKWEGNGKEWKEPHIFTYAYTTTQHHHITDTHAYWKKWKNRREIRGKNCVYELAIHFERQRMCTTTTTSIAQIATAAAAATTAVVARREKKNCIHKNNIIKSIFLCSAAANTLYKHVVY